MSEVAFSEKNALIPEYIRRTTEIKILELMEFGVSCEICKEMHKPVAGMAQMLNTYVSDSFARQAIRFAAKWYCPSEMKKEVRYPTNWRESFKDRWFPEWLKTRYPVRYTVYKIYEMFPEVSWPKNMGHKMNVFVRKTEGGLD